MSVGNILNDGKVEIFAFTDKGEALADRIGNGVGGNASRSGKPDGVRKWTADRFPVAEALIFVGAVAIAVRAIAPYVDDKTRDPAVVVVDESGHYVIPVLSGHLGGANDLARKIAGICGGEAVITTATDVRGVFAVDEWTRKHNCTIVEPEKIKTISGGLLAGRTMTVRSAWKAVGKAPDGFMTTEAEEADIALDIHITGERPLHIVPRICKIGIGCRRGTKASSLEHFYHRLLLEKNIHPAAIAGAATIDIKADEPGLVEFCRNNGWELEVFSAFELEQVKGEFSGSAFVNKVVGVDNVCERSAVLATSGTLICTKTAGEGITMAIAAEEYRPDWRWKDE